MFFSSRAIVTGRLAPTPSGGLHLGNVRTFLIAWRSARVADGRHVENYQIGFVKYAEKAGSLVTTTRPSACA